MKTVILAAGFGSRLWPLSTSDRPKQFQNFLNDKSLLQYTYALLNRVIPAEDIFVVTLNGLDHFVTEQLPEISPSNIIVVPERRNTFPHTLYALRQLNLQPDEPVLVTPSDHFLSDPDTFITQLKEVLQTAFEPKETYMLCTKAETINPSLGYMQVNADGTVARFIEKPDPEQARALSAENNIYMNTMRFITSMTAIQAQLDSSDDEVASAAKAFIAAPEDKLQAAFLAMPEMDLRWLFSKESGIRIQEIDSDFVDIGKFATLYEINQKDSNGNATIGEVILEGCQNNFVINQLPQPLVVINAKNSVVAQTEAGMVVAPMEDADKVGTIYKEIIHG